MGRDWDSFDPKEYQEWCEEWAALALDALKPGGHLLAFSGNRTHHRLFSGVQDAGFELRDTVTWHYGSGFPKALDVSKAIDKTEDAEREDLGPNPNAVGRKYNKTGGDYNNGHKESRAESDRITAPATDAAVRWDGFKTALKPATEFVCVARAPFDGTVAENIQRHGTGALNIDATRVGTETRENPPTSHDDNCYDDAGDRPTERVTGRYPSNVVFGEQPAAQLDRDVGELGGGEKERQEDMNNNKCDTNVHSGYKGRNKSMYVDDDYDGGMRSYGDTGGPSRYFYTSKASRAERTHDGKIDNDHPTVKPVDLMEWLVKLVTAENQIICDPFAGSGTTLLAAKNKNRRFIGIEQNESHVSLAQARVGLTPDDPSVCRESGVCGLEDFGD
jgi:site-specific DNA-methyltransferase (adenine-specific)